MEWLGKDTIQKIGFSIGGAIGKAIIEGTETLVVDESDINKDDILYTEKDASALAFEAAIFCIFAKMSTADCVVQIEEETIIRAFLDGNEYDKRTTEFLLQVYNNVIINTVSVKDYITQYKEITENMENEKEIAECDQVLLETLVALSISDDIIRNEEMDILHAICDTLEIEREYLTYLLEDFDYQE